MYKPSIHRITVDSTDILNKVKKAIEEGATINEQNKHGYTFVMELAEALTEDNLPTFKYLVQHNDTDINLVSKRQMTVLQILSEKLSFGVYLYHKPLNYLAAINVVLGKDIKDESTLDYSLHCLAHALLYHTGKLSLQNDHINQHYIPIINLLLEKGANPNALNSDPRWHSRGNDRSAYDERFQPLKDTSSVAKMISLSMEYTGQFGRNIFSCYARIFDFIQCVLNNSKMSFVELIIDRPEQQQFFKELLPSKYNNLVISNDNLQNYFSCQSRATKNSVFTFCCVVNRWNNGGVSPTMNNALKTKFPKVLRNIIVQQMGDACPTIIINNTESKFIFAFDSKKKIIIESEEQCRLLLKQDKSEEKQSVVELKNEESKSNCLIC